MARDLRLNIEGDSSSADRAFAKATAALEKTARELKSAETRTEALAVKARKLAESEERAADKTRDLAEKTAILRKQIEETGDETGQLGKKLDRLARDTKFAALATDDYRRAADRAAGEAREQARAYDKLGDNARQAARDVALLGAASAVSPNGKGAVGGGAGLLSGISAGFLKGGLGGAGSALEGTLGTPVLGPALLALLASVAIPAASFVGGAAGGGVLAGLGAGGAGLGLAGAWQTNPDKYAAKWEQATDRIKKRWLDSSQAFGNELEFVLKVADRTLRNLPVEKVLALSQSFVAPLAEGAGQGIVGLASGIADALERVQPVVDKVGPALGNLGHDLGDTFRIISQGSEGGADALSDLIGAIGYTAKALGVLILGFEDAYEGFRNFVIGVNTVIITLPLIGPIIYGLEVLLTRIASTSIRTGRTLANSAKSSESMAHSWGEMAKAGAEATIKTIELNDALTQLRNTQLASANAGLAVAQGWLDLNEELKEGAKTLNLNTQEGIDNQKQIIAQAQALEQQREETIKLGHETPEAIAAANAAYDTGIQKIREMAHAAGFTDAEVDELLRSYGLIPPVVSTQINTTGLSSALGQGISLGNALNRIDGRTYHATVSFSAVGTWVLDAARAAGAHARGGTFPSTGPKKVGEHGMELIWGNRGEYVSTAEETRKLAAMAGSASAGNTASSAVGLQVMAGADPFVGHLVQQLIDRGYIQAFAGGSPVTTRRGG